VDGHVILAAAPDRTAPLADSHHRVMALGDGVSLLTVEVAGVAGGLLLVGRSPPGSLGHTGWI
jgi:hypothetical protein